MAKTGKKTKAHSGRALHIGLNAVSPAHYDGWSGPLGACEFDAHDMAALATSKGMSSGTLLTTHATRKEVLSGIRAAAKALKSGDLFLLTYSGHGGQVDDEVNGDEDDGFDETWCLYDGQLLDDELYYELSQFASGVRVLVLSDSCHSGTVTRASVPSGVAAAGRSRMMPPDVARRTYEKNKAFYRKIQKATAALTKRKLPDPDTVLAGIAANPSLAKLVAKFKPAVILISGCQDNQTSLDGAKNGAFTEQVLAVWNNGGFQGSYVKFHADVRSALPASQSPNLFLLGKAAAFSREQPFTV